MLLESRAGVALARPWHSPGTAPARPSPWQVTQSRPVWGTSLPPGIWGDYPGGGRRGQPWTRSCKTCGVRKGAPSLPNLSVEVSRETGTGMKQQPGDNAHSDTPNSPRAPRCVLDFKSARKGQKKQLFRQPGMECVSQAGHGRFRVVLGRTRAVPAPVPVPASLLLPSLGQWC